MLTDKYRSVSIGESSFSFHHTGQKGSIKEDHKSDSNFNGSQDICMVLKYPQLNCEGKISNWDLGHTSVV